MRILVIEDETMLRTSITRGLSKIVGATVVDAGELDLALVHLDGTPPDVIVSDIDLPNRSGLELLGELGRRGLRVPVIFVSGYLQAYRSQIPPHADVEVMEKPVSLEELRAIVMRRARPSKPSIELAPFGVADYLQLAGLGRHSVLLEVEQDGALLGEIVVWCGETWFASDRQGGGEAALKRLAFVKGSSVRCKTLLERPEERNLPGHWEMVLLEAARKSDEEAQSGSTTDAEALGELTWGASEAPQPAPPPLPPRRAAEDIAFEEAWDEGIDALLSRDYPAALRAFLVAKELKPDDSKVHANIKRLAELGVTHDPSQSTKAEAME